MTRRAKAFPVTVGDRFKARNGEIWTVTERGLFGHPHWVISNDRCRQTTVKGASLALMERTVPARVGELGSLTWETETAESASYGVRCDKCGEWVTACKCS